MGLQYQRPASIESDSQCHVKECTKGPLARPGDGEAEAARLRTYLAAAALARRIYFRVIYEEEEDDVEDEAEAAEDEEVDLTLQRR